MFKNMHCELACTKSWSTNYESLIVSCNMDKLADRRNNIISRLCLLFKIISGDVLFDSPPFEQVYHQYLHRHQNTQQLSVQFAKTNQFQSSFFLDTTSAWN